MYLSVLKCGSIGELVFSISNKSDFDIFGGFENIVDIDGLFENYNNLNDFSNYLKDKYYDTISQENYSINSYYNSLQYVILQTNLKLRNGKSRNYLCR